MRKSLTLWTLSAVVLSLGIGCKQQADTKTATVQTSLFMTGSGSKNVIQSNTQ